MISVRLWCVFVTLLWLAHPSYPHVPVTIHTLYGLDTITEPVLIELLQSNALNRLHRINQYGIRKFTNPEEDYTRYQHSVGVLYLLRRYGASLEEQVMGLLHDVSHTAFSHVADYMFNTVQEKYSYQDTIFAWFVENTDLQEILDRYNLLWITDITVRDQFKMLKDDLPKLCVDRLEYNLYGGYLEGILTHDDIMMILDALEYRDKSWVFTDYTAAHLFANTVLYLSTHIWCADWNCYVYSETAKLLKHALDTQLITEDDLIFSDDATIWNRLNAAAPHDAIIQQQLHRILHYKDCFTHGTPETHDYVTQGKFRWIDPLVITCLRSKAPSGEACLCHELLQASPCLRETLLQASPLSSIDRAFADEIQMQKKRFKEPHYIRYINAS